MSRDRAVRRRHWRQFQKLARMDGFSTLGDLPEVAPLGCPECGERWRFASPKLGAVIVRLFRDGGTDSKGAPVHIATYRLRPALCVGCKVPLLVGEMQMEQPALAAWRPIRRFWRDESGGCLFDVAHASVHYLPRGERPPSTAPPAHEQVELSRRRVPDGEERRFLTAGPGEDRRAIVYEVVGDRARPLGDTEHLDANLDLEGMLGEPEFPEPPLDAISWIRTPAPLGQRAISGILEVDALVETEWGVVWRPHVEVRLDLEHYEDGEFWTVDVDNGLAGGEIHGGRIEWLSGAFDSHSVSVSEFLSLPGETARLLEAIGALAD